MQKYPVTRFERHAALASGRGSLNLDENTAVLLAADNFDHNSCTLNGKNTFHGMSMIAAITPKIAIFPDVYRRHVDDIDIKKVETVHNRGYRSTRSMLTEISFHDLPVSTPNISKLSLLWQISSAERSGSGWSGTMQAIHSGTNVISRRGIDNVPSHREGSK